MTRVWIFSPSQLVHQLRELGIYVDEDGHLRYAKNNQVITMDNLTTDPLLTVTAITQYVRFDASDPT